MLTPVTIDGFTVACNHEPCDHALDKHSGCSKHTSHVKFATKNLNLPQSNIQCWQCLSPPA